MQSLDVRCMWLVFKPPDVACEQRLIVARELLETLQPDSDASRSDTPWKIAWVLQSQLSDAVRTGGTLCPHAHKLLSHVFAMRHCDTQEIEGMNSM
eukprot:3952206-Alexandrium_andersonii.AAC.1